jgi:hypothetical protein
MNPWYNNFSGPAALGPGAGLLFAFGGLLFAVVLIWSLFWKGMALWKAAREGSKVWFVVLLIVNTLGILEILYIYVFSRKPGKMD